VIRFVANTLTALSLLTCVEVCALWVRSHFVIDLSRFSGDRKIELSIARGKASVSHMSQFSGQDGSWNYRPVEPGTRLWHGARDGHWRVERFILRVRGDERRPDGTVLGFGWRSGDSVSGQGLFRNVRTVGWGFRVPLWFLAALAAVAPVIRFHAAVCRRRRAPVGRCRVCGYDLRATPDRCPECGTEPTPSAPEPSPEGAAVDWGLTPAVRRPAGSS